MTRTKLASSSRSKTSEINRRGPGIAASPPTFRASRTPGLVQMVLVTYVPGKGWLATRRGAIYGGHHGRPPLIEDSLERVMEVMTVELRSGIRAMQHRVRRED